jgi:hypothetical protein
VAQKKVSAALRPMNYESWSIQTTLSSASAVSVLCWVCRDPRSTTGMRQCVNRRCGSWPGSMLSTWRIPAAVAAGWSITWPEKGSRSVATGCETSCTAWVYGRSTRSLSPRWPAIPPSGFPAWWISRRSRRWIKCRPTTSPTSRWRRDSFTWWRSWISIPDMCSAGSCRTVWIRNSVWSHWRWPSAVVAGQRPSTPTRDASSPPATLWAGYRRRRSGSAGQAESAAKTTSLLSGCGGQSSMRRSICVRTAMAGGLRSAWPASYGGTAM